MQDKLIREYVPLRDYDVEVNGLAFLVVAEVQRIDGSYDFAEPACPRLYYDGVGLCLPDALLNSYTSKGGETWRTLIEREVCYQAEKLTAFAWVTEYETQSERNLTEFDREWKAEREDTGIDCKGRM